MATPLPSLWYWLPLQQLTRSIGPVGKSQICRTHWFAERQDDMHHKTSEGVACYLHSPYQRASIRLHVLFTSWYLFESLSNRCPDDGGLRTRPTPLAFFYVGYATVTEKGLQRA